MVDYRPPLNDIAFAFDVVGYSDVAALAPFAHADPATTTELLAEFGRFVAEVFAPLNRAGDQVGARFDPQTGQVRTADGFPTAYRAYIDAGWNAVPFAPEFGGGGFPWMVALAMQEMLTSANMGLSLCPLLTQGAIDALSHHGDETQQALYLGKMISGEWTGTMNLTEPEAGSDVGALRARALPHPDGSWRIFGQKIYISYGDHDLTDNIVHLVLARVPEAPAGTKGISCFIVPKFLVEADGSIGARNDVRCLSLEHKLGIHASPTCVMAYGEDGDGAVGYLVGEPNTGMRTMFTMMNNARLSVGMQGLALSELAYQFAVEHALGRVQGRTVTGDAAIIGHPDVRRTLLTIRSHVEAMRLLLYSNARAIDEAAHGRDDDVRHAARERADFLTPLSKGWSTDLGNELVSMALQVHGGMGYVEETGIAQLFRDMRIAAIYEGTNGIQALDLMGRKLTMRSGGVVADLIAEFRAVASSLEATEADAARALGTGLDALERMVDWMTHRLSDQIADAMAAATPFLRVMATTVAAALMGRQLLHADSDARRLSARFFVTQVLPQVAGLEATITAGARDLLSLSAADFPSS